MNENKMGVIPIKKLLINMSLPAIYAVSFMLLGFIAFQIFPNQLLQLFKSSAEMSEIAIFVFRTISFTFLVAGITVLCSTAFQGMGKSHLSL